MLIRARVPPLAAPIPAGIPESVDLGRWQADAQKLWDRDQRQDAINLLLQRINGARPELPRLPALQLSYYVFLLGDFAGAEQFMRRLHQAYPHDLEILENLAVMLGRQRKDGEAIAAFERLLELGSTNVNCWDGLAAAFARSGRLEEARQAGERALAIKTAAAQPLPGWQPPAARPLHYLQRPGALERRDVIAFSIWGANPRYLRGALRNALLIPDLYPGWDARFYLDETVPEEYRGLLDGLGAECQLMPAGQGLRQKLCWRFLVANDEGVGRFLVRDCDSVVTQREVAAVQAWQASDHWFHVMRDWWTHTDPMLAGMWGGIAGVLPDLQELLLAYQPAARETANVDQWFLRDVLWGSVGSQALIHDRCYSSEGSQPWPTPTPDGDRHVGQDEYTVQRQWQAQQLAAWIQRYPCLQLPGEKAVGAKREIDLRLVPTVWISMDKHSPASARIRTLLADAGFEHLQWSPGVAVKADRPVSRERLHAAGVALAHRQALLAHPGDGPLLLLEDDVALEQGIELNFALPADADAVWVGVSRYGKPKIQPVNKQVSRISRMFSTHAVLYLSAAFKRHAIQCVEQCLDCHLPFDIGLAFYQQDFNIYALNQPVFYQAASADAAHDFEGLTRFSLAELK